MLTPCLLSFVILSFVIGKRNSRMLKSKLCNDTVKAMQWAAQRWSLAGMEIIDDNKGAKRGKKGARFWVKNYAVGDVRVCAEGRVLRFAPRERWKFAEDEKSNCKRMLTWYVNKRKQERHTGRWSSNNGKQKSHRTTNVQWPLLWTEVPLNDVGRSGLLVALVVFES